jgi:hypothetical protein
MRKPFNWILGQAIALLILAAFAYYQPPKCEHDPAARGSRRSTSTT